jgi:hypothetical protein
MVTKFGHLMKMGKYTLGAAQAEKTMKKLVVVSTILSMLGSSALAHAADDQKNSKQQPKKLLNNPVPLFESYDNQGVNLGVRADILYMIYSVPTLTYVSKQTLVGTELDSDIVSVPGKLSLGCDLALTYTMPHCPGYSFEAGWYHIVAKFSDAQAANNLDPAHIVSVVNPAPGTASTVGHVAINFFDLFLSKTYSFGSFFSFSPMVGMVGGYMNSKNTSNFNATSSNFGRNTTSVYYFQSSKYEGLGVKLGTGYKFDIWCGLKLTGNFTYNILYGLSRSTVYLTSNGSFLTGSGVASGTAVSVSQHQGRSFIDSLVSLAWQKTFSDDSFFIDVHAGWKTQAYQSGYIANEAELNDASQSNWLFGQGLEAGVAFKF